jgi:hypothetical protein
MPGRPSGKRGATVWTEELSGRITIPGAGLETVQINRRIARDLDSIYSLDIST